MFIHLAYAIYKQTKKIQVHLAWQIIWLNDQPNDFTFYQKEVWLHCILVIRVAFISK